MWLMRFRLRRWRVTAPVMLVDGEAVLDSYDIAKWADSHRLPSVQSICSSACTPWVDIAEVFMASQRCVARFWLRRHLGHICMPGMAGSAHALQARARVAEQCAWVQMLSSHTDNTTL